MVQSRRRDVHVPQASPRGTYLQISEALRQDIAGGRITDRLPSKAELMDRFDVAASTIERAIAVLKSEGLVESVQGAAVFVTGTGDRRPLVERITDLLRAPGVNVGDRFPTENELCQRFDASRTAVRSAVAQLEGRGFIAKRSTRQREVTALPKANKANKGDAHDRSGRDD